MKKSTKNRLEYIGFRIAYGLFSVLPYAITWRVISRLFVFTGLVLGMRRKVAEKNITMIYPELKGKELKKFLKDMYSQMGLTTAETYFGDYEKMFKRVKVVGIEHLEQAMAMDKGVIMASAHFGNWELAGRYIAQRYKLSIIYKRLRNNYVDVFTNKIREEYNITLIEKRRALRKVLKMLKEHFIVTIMIDQNAKKQGVNIDFLGKPASTFVGVAKIALKTGTPIFTGISVRENDGSHTLHFGEVIDPKDFNDNEFPIKSLTQAVSKKIEPFILKYPTQWFWVHRRWRSFKKARKDI